MPYATLKGGVLSPDGVGTVCLYKCQRRGSVDVHARGWSVDGTFEVEMLAHSQVHETAIIKVSSWVTRLPTRSQALHGGDSAASRRPRFA